MRALMGQKERQRFYYDKHTKPLQPIHQGDTVRMRLPGQRTWSPGTCMGQVGPCSYEAKVGDSIYRRNRRQLVRSNEPPVPETPEMVPSTSEPEQAELPSQSPKSPVSQQQPAPQSLRRSQHIRRPPARLNDFVPS